MVGSQTTTDTAERLKLPQRLFSTCVTVGVATPFLSRLPSVPIRGWEWFSSYTGGAIGSLFIGMLSVIPALVLFGLGKASRRAPLTFWLALAAMAGFLLFAHGTLNLRSSSTAALAFLFLPAYAAATALAGWIAGWIAHAVVRKESNRLWVARVSVAAAVVVGIGVSVQDSISAATREARFPIITVSAIPLTKRRILPPEALGPVEVLALDNSTSKSDGDGDVLALGRTAIARLSLSDYSVKTRSTFEQRDCDGCVHMYPYLVRDDNGTLFVATSDGLADSHGKLLWRNEAQGFSRTVPIHAGGNQVRFIQYYPNDRIELRSSSGETLWTVKLPVDDVGAYVAPDGSELPFALCGYGDARKLQVFDMGGKLARTISLPGWANTVHSVSWPSPGHLLVGQGGLLGVLDSNGKEIMHHAITDTSFTPYHGPDGVAVRFKAGEAPYLVVASHGSSGYARSVLLVFDAAGRLVWKEEVEKLSTLLAVDKPDQQRDVLLVGGSDGVLEYRLAD